jgi:beta-lactamase class A
MPILPVTVRISHTLASCALRAVACLNLAAGGLSAHAQGLRTDPPAPAVLGASAGTAWEQRLLSQLPRVDDAHRADIGVYVRDLASGISVGYKAGQDWYIASSVKVPVAIAVLRAVEAGQLSLDTPVTLRASDYVDGAGNTNRQAVGTPLPVRLLIDQMIIHSDNTATDMLIDLVGVRQVNDVVTSLVPQGFGRITTLAGVRRLVYGQLTPAASRLAGQDLLQLHRQPDDKARLALLSRLTGVPQQHFRLKTLDAAWRAYYASGANSARLDAYGELLSLIATGHALEPQSTRYLLGVMKRTVTGSRRIRAGLPPGTVFAHKTGTQRQRVCDSGLVSVRGAAQPVVIVACAQGEPSTARGENALRDVGAAICRSGLITSGVTDAPACPVVPPDAVAPSKSKPAPASVAGGPRAGPVARPVAR